MTEQRDRVRCTSGRVRTSATSALTVFCAVGLRPRTWQEPRCRESASRIAHRDPPPPLNQQGTDGQHALLRQRARELHVFACKPVGTMQDNHRERARLPPAGRLRLGMTPSSGTFTCDPLHAEICRPRRRLDRHRFGEHSDVVASSSQMSRDAKFIISCRSANCTFRSSCARGARGANPCLRRRSSPASVAAAQRRLRRTCSR